VGPSEFDIRKTSQPAAPTRCRRFRINGPHPRAISCPAGLAASLETDMTSQTDKIRSLNDELRQHLLGGGAVITPGIAALGAKAVERIVQTIAVFDDFCRANDPYSEHDFGAFEVEGENVFFKIDYYDKTLRAGSPDPSDPNVTERVITIMLAEEY
jgi:hypothetical protein